MRRGHYAQAILGAAAAFGAAGLSLALLGLGIPFVGAALLAACCAGLLIFALGRTLSAGTAPSRPDADPPASERVRQLEERGAVLRHELRGVLSPALMVSDRLLKNEDPAIRRAGETVIRSVERATVLIVQNKKETAPDAPSSDP